jgi:predicted phage-related endonuclease
MSVIQIHNVEQGTPEWHALRAGLPTASCFDHIIARKKDGKPTAARQKYLYTLAGQRLTGQIVETYSGGALERGKVMEDEARKFYVFQSDQTCEQVGFVTNSIWRAGASPDSLVGSAGMLEIKTKEPHILLECLEADEVPEEHIAQCQGQLAVGNRAWVDFCAYWPGMPKFIKRLERNEPYIAKLRVEVDQFNEELDALVEKYK